LDRLIKSHPGTEFGSQISILLAKLYPSLERDRTAVEITKQWISTQPFFRKFPIAPYDLPTTIKYGFIAGPGESNKSGLAYAEAYEHFLALMQDDLTHGPEMLAEQKKKVQKAARALAQASQLECLVKSIHAIVAP